MKTIDVSPGEARIRRLEIDKADIERSIRFNIRANHTKIEKAKRIKAEIKEIRANLNK
jgi:hypothetical protein